MALVCGCCSILWEFLKETIFLQPFVRIKGNDYKRGLKRHAQGFEGG